MNSKLYDFVKEEYPDVKSDMSTVCMRKTISMCNEHGYMAMINIPVWMFISSYGKLRTEIITRNLLYRCYTLGEEYLVQILERQLWLLGTDLSPIIVEHTENYL